MERKGGDRREFLQGILAAGGVAAGAGQTTPAQRAPADLPLLPAEQPDFSADPIAN